MADYIQGDDEDNPEAEIYSSQDYYAFGMIMPGRSYTFTGNSSLNRYRWGWNGAENIDEVKGYGNTPDLGDRWHDPRLTRLNWKTDRREAEYPWQSPYAYYGNTPVWKLDYNGEGDDDGGGFRVPMLPKFPTNTSSVIANYSGAVSNAGIEILNTPATMINSGISIVESARKGTFLKDLGSELKGIGTGIQNFATSSSGEMLGKTFSPEGVETMTGFGIGLLTGKVNVKSSPLKPSGPVKIPLFNQIVGKPASSKILADNMIGTGIARSTNTAAHHIVAGNHSNLYAVQSRQILQRAGVDINHSSNGVFLPKNTQYAKPPATTHSIVHTNTYFRNVYDRISNVPLNRVADELKMIGDELLQGTFKY